MKAATDAGLLFRRYLVQLLPRSGHPGPRPAGR